MIEALNLTKTVYTVSQYLDWQRQGTLDLSPIFQRRPVWKAPAKSLLIDSVVRGYPVPIVLLRQVQDLKSLAMKMEVVDGQQRLFAQASDKLDCPEAAAAAAANDLLSQGAAKLVDASR